MTVLVKSSFYFIHVAIKHTSQFKQLQNFERVFKDRPNGTLHDYCVYLIIFKLPFAYSQTYKLSFLSTHTP